MHHDALRVALYMRVNLEDTVNIIKVFAATEDDLMEVIGNVNLNQQFLSLAQELDVQEAKTPADIYKSHLVDGHGSALARRAGGNTVDSAKQNLASTFVNAFVNCAFGSDTLITPEGSDWLYKNKTHGMLSAAASSGMVLLWDVDTGFSSADKYSHSAQSMIKAGGLLATGMLNSGICNPEMDAAYALLSEHIDDEEDKDMKVAAVFGLGLAYAGTGREDILEILVPLIVDSSQGMETVALTCLSLGLTYVGSCNEDLAGSFVEAFLDRSDADLRDPMARTMCLGFGLLYMGCGAKCDSAIESLKAIEHPIRKYLEVTIQTCAYAGTANVLEIQKLVQMVTERVKVEDEDDEEKKEEGAAGAGAGATAAAADKKEGDKKDGEKKEEK